MKATSRREDDMEAMVKNVDEQEDYSLYGQRKDRCYSRSSKKRGLAIIDLPFE